MATPKFADFDEQALDRIIEAAKTRLPNQTLPSQFDRDALYDDLVSSHVLYHRASPAAFKPNKLRLIGIRKSTIKLVSLMEADAADFGLIREISATLLPQLKALIAVLDKPGMMQMKARDFSDRIKERLNIPGSALQALTGHWLPNVYEKHFQRAAGSSRSLQGGPPDGPYIRFARQVLIEWEIKGSAETIDAALSQHGKGP
jgi:hypothetical protein